MDVIKRDRSRVPYLDLLRIVAMLAVVTLHVSGDGWTEVDNHTSTWRFLNIYDSIVRWGVPIFVMVSGAPFWIAKGLLTPSDFTRKIYSS